MLREELFNKVYDQLYFKGVSNVSVEEILDRCNVNGMPLYIFEGYDEDDDREVGEVYKEFKIELT